MKIFYHVTEKRVKNTYASRDMVDDKGSNGEAKKVFLERLYGDWRDLEGGRPQTLGMTPFLSNLGLKLFQVMKMMKHRRMRNV